MTSATHGAAPAAGSPSPVPARGLDAATQNLVRQRVRTALASTLEPGLPAVPFGEWLFTTLAPLMELPWETHADWRVRFCDDSHFPIPEGGKDLCVDALVRMTAEKFVHIVVAAAEPTTAGGDGQQRWRPLRLSVRDAYVERSDGIHVVDSLDVASLRDLANMLTVPVDEWPVADLVATISAHHVASAPVHLVRFTIDVTNKGTRPVTRAFVRMRLQCDGESEMLRDWFPAVGADQSIRLEFTAPVTGRAIAVVTIGPTPGSKAMRESRPRRDPAVTIVGGP